MTHNAMITVTPQDCGSWHLSFSKANICISRPKSARAKHEACIIIFEEIFLLPAKPFWPGARSAALSS